VQGYSFRVCLELDHVLSLTKKTVTPKLLRGNHPLHSTYPIILFCFAHLPSLLTIFFECHILLIEQFGDTIMSLPNVKLSEEENNRVLADSEVEEVIVDEMATVVWRQVYLNREDITMTHILEFDK